MAKFKITEQFKMPEEKKFLEWDMENDGLTQSMLTTWRKCPSKARAALKGLYKPGESKAIIFGSVFHEAIDKCLNDYRNKIITNPEQYKENAYKKEVEIYLNEKFNKEYIVAGFDGKKWYREAYTLVTMMFPLYMNFWKEDFFGERAKEFLEIEEQFKVQPLAFSELTLRGKRDAIYSDSRGLWLMEHKTKSQIPEDALSMTISRDLQVMIYLLSYRLEHEKYLNGVLYNIIRKPALRLKSAETWPEYLRRCEKDIKSRSQFYFIRYEVLISEDAQKNFYKSLEAELNRFIAWENTVDSYDAQHTHECNAVYGKCPYIEYCDSNKKDLSLLKVRESFHPELV